MKARPHLTVRICGFLLCVLNAGCHGVSSGTPSTKTVDDVRNLFDPKHGIQMGIPFRQCDDGVHGIEMDWNPLSTAEYTCYSSDLTNINFQIIAKDITDNSDEQPMHICLNEPIYYPNALPLSGSHRPLWPVFGEYKYLPPQRWVHALEHGAIALLYHPCMHRSPELAALKSLVRDCLGKHVITPYRNIPFDMPFALLAFKHARLIGQFNPRSEHDVNFFIDFIKRYALEGPETHVLDNGQYSAGLIRNATEFSDLQEDKSSLCSFLK